MGKRRLAFGLAGPKTVTQLWGSTFRAFLSAALAMGGSVVTYKIMSGLGRDWAGDALIPVFVGPALLFAVFVLLFLYNWLSGVPYDEWGEHEERIAALEDKLSPRFEVFPFVGRKPERVTYGTTHISISGKRHSVVPSAGSAEFLTLPVENVRSVTLKACEAYLTNFQRADPDTENWVWEPVRLSWLPMGTEAAITDIPSRGQRSLILFRVVGNTTHLVESKNGIPLQMVTAIAEKGDYYGYVTISGHDAIATHIAFELHCDAPDHAPTITVMRRRFGEESDDTSWATEKEFLG